MDSYAAIFIIIIIVVIVIRIFDNQKKMPRRIKEYRYVRKQYLLTRSEQIFFHTLVTAVGHEYCIFTQVHLSSLLQHKVVGQNWRGAFRHIDEKSVDFVLCDKKEISPILAIELDDATHERPDRELRDAEVERILYEAGLPLLRIDGQATYDADTVSDEIKNILSKNR